MIKYRTAIICQEDKLWALYAMNKVFLDQDLNQQLDYVAFWNCDEKFVNIKKDKVPQYYFNVFGWYNFVKLGVFAVFFKIMLILKSILGNYKISFKGLCEANGIPYFKTKSPNSKDVVKWVEENNIDVVLIMVGNILKPAILNAPKVCTINKHAGVLPGNKGMFPYFWARLKDEPQGVSFHKVIEDIDEGAILYQERVEKESIIKSMISFYFFVHKNYARMFSQAIQNLKNGIEVTPDPSITPSYQSVPYRPDYLSFRKKGKKIILLSDLFLVLKL